MKKNTYIIINVIAILLSIFFIIMGNWGMKTFGFVILAAVAAEFFSGRYKKYVNNELTEKEAADQNKSYKRMLLPFKIIGIIIVLFIIFIVIKKLFS